MADEDAFMVPEPPVKFTIPSSDSTVEVRVIDSGALLYIDPDLFWSPSEHSLPGPHAPIYCFLISHGSKHALFDLGLRADWKTYAPEAVSIIGAITKVTPGPDVATLLDNDTSGLNIRSKDISSIIWSHNHFDHTGDPSTFSTSTELVVGPGVKAASWPGYPTNPKGMVLDSDAAGRTVREIDFEAGLKIGRFNAHDFFGDGSFYLLDAPGHAVGHLCALARTTAEPASFVFMGADACHHPGLLRPTKYQPLPRSINLKLHANQPNADRGGKPPRAPAPCPGQVIQHVVDQTRETPFFEVPKTFLFSDHDAAKDTVTKIHELDSRDDVFVLIAHDLSVRESIPLFPQKIDGWRDMNLKTETRWLFCDEFMYDK